MPDDAELLHRFANDGLEEPFAEFVRRYVDFVYGCALRRVGGDAHAAEDVTQQVFVAAARRARILATHPAPSGWLYTAARNIAAQLVRTERRRQAREQEAQRMNEQLADCNGPNEWERVRPVLDDALDALSESDRQAVLLRFFEGKSFAEIGARLRVAENAARMRVDRALDKLHAVLAQRGVTSTTAALAVVLTSQIGVAAPAGLAAAASTAALSGAGAAAAAAGFMGMTKLQLGLAGALVVAGTTGFIVQRQEVTDLRQNLAAAEQQVRSVTQAEAAQAASAQAPGGRSAELGRLQAEIRAVRAELNSAAARPPAVVAPPAVVESPIVGPVYDMQALDRAPKPTSQIAPRYPRSLRGAGVQGEAVIEFVVATDGTVRSPRVVKCSHPELADAALEAVRRWTFNPGEKDGKSVASRVQIPLVFRLNNEEQAEAVGAEVVPWF